MILLLIFFSLYYFFTAPILHNLTFSSNSRLGSWCWTLGLLFGWMLGLCRLKEQKTNQILQFITISTTEHFVLYILFAHFVDQSNIYRDETSLTLYIIGLRPVKYCKLQSKNNLPGWGQDIYNSLDKYKYQNRYSNFCLSDSRFYVFFGSYIFSLFCTGGILTTCKN